MAGSRLVIPSQQPVQSTGLPYTGGQLFFYLSGTNTPTPTYADSGLTTPNTNPVILDSSGNAGNVFLDPSIVYKIVLENSAGASIWTYDPVYPFAASSIQGLNVCGVSTGTANAQVVTGPGIAQNGQAVIFTAGFTNTGAMTFNTGSGVYNVYQPTSAGPALLAGNEIQAQTMYLFMFSSSLNSNTGGWQLIASFSLAALGITAAMLPIVTAASTAAAYIGLGGAIVAPTGRLTLTSGTPILVSPVSAATSVIFTPINGNQAPLWNGSAWGMATFAELSDLLSETTHSPAAAVANGLYDYFIWQPTAGSWVLSRGPAWTNSTTRSLALTRVQGFLTNASAITNGPAIGYGLYVGTIACDPGGGTVTYNPYPAAASGGPSGGAWVGLWNEYQRIPITALAQDSNASWTWSTASWREADASANNRVTFVLGNVENASLAAIYVCFGTQSSSQITQIGIGYNSTSTPFQGTLGVTPGGVTVALQSASVSGYGTVGLQYFQALEYSAGGTQTFYGSGIGTGQTQHLSATWSY